MHMRPRPLKIVNMPELPEVETLARALRPVMEGAQIERVDLNRKDLRFPFPPAFAERLENVRIEQLSRRAKYILAYLSSKEVLIIHLGMTGSCLIERPSAAFDPSHYYHTHARKQAHDHVIFHFKGGTRITYNDPRRFGFMELLREADWQEHKLFAALGPEPLSEAFNPDDFAKTLQNKSISIKVALLDQKNVAGIGNIYASEALFRAGIHPEKPASSLTTPSGAPTKALQRLVPACKEVLIEAIRAGGSTLRDFVSLEGEEGHFQESFAVYDRENLPCIRPTCKGMVRRVTQAGRSTFFCPVCQKAKVDAP
jgi:formamidopyrimidine-DNA glycosylase